VLAQVRNSLAGPQPSLAYRISADGGLPTVEWLGTSPASADELLGGGTRKEDNPRDRAAAFLEQFLAAGPRTSREVWEAAQQAGLSDRTVRRARRGLGICRQYVFQDGRPVSYWALPGQEVPGSRTGSPELDHWVAELEKEYAPPTPLDEEDPDEDLP
jgi:hypothetical protein